jgi:formate dehydrogenase subunit delta
MNEQHLIEMANRIGEFFESMPDRDEALVGISEHIRSFWEPRMRRVILNALDNASASTMREIVRAALSLRRAELEPRSTAFVTSL